MVQKRETLQCQGSIFLLSCCCTGLSMWLPCGGTRWLLESPSGGRRRWQQQQGLPLSRRALPRDHTQYLHVNYSRVLIPSWGVARKCGVVMRPAEIRDGMTNEKGKDGYCSPFWHFANAVSISQKTSGVSMGSERTSLLLSCSQYI